ncbi:MAG TPA: DoxX family protein [Gemmatimonadaceae bacterium]|nr:DoxX family protein [Gemmatimonadaceae bacterium]
MRAINETSHRKAGIALWTVQVLLALVFLFAGGSKLVMPYEMLKGPFSFPELFIRFIGVCEFFGGVGLILPTALRIKAYLTPLAAAGLVIIMIGATVTTLLAGMGAGAIVPAVVGILAATVAYGRWRVVPVRAVARTIPIDRYESHTARAA